MKKIITAWDIELCKEAGKTVMEYGENDIVTAIAEENARRLGVSLVRTAASPQHQALAGAQPSSPVTTGADVLSEDFARQWQGEFPLLAHTIHVANCSQAPQAKRVRRAIEDYLDSWLTAGMDWEYWIEETIKAKHEFARLINASPDEIALSTSVSEATASIASALDPLGARRRILTTEAEFPTVGHVWLASQKYGYKVDYVPVRNGEILLEDYRRLLDEETVLTSVTHVYYQNGFKQDLGAIARIIHEKGSLFYVDAYQSLGTVDLDVKQMDIDILSSGNLKYLLGIPGIAFIYVKKDLISCLKPAVTGWFGQENPFSFQVRYLDYASDSRRFDTGTPPVLTAFAARAGMEIINEVGPKNIEKRINMLSEYTIGLAQERGLELLSPLDVKKKGSTTAIRVDDSHQVEIDLKKHNIIASARGNAIRIAPHFYTTKENLKHVMDCLAGLLRK